MMAHSARLPWKAAVSTRMLTRAAAVAIVILAALLRLDAFVGKYGPLDRPAWARIATRQVAPAAARLRPSGVQWYPEARPYEGGDPINYLAYARQMVSFYQPHVREPVFLASTRLALWSLDGQDAAVSLASIAGSVLAVLATYLLGAALLSPAAGLIASLLLAIEYEAIAWAPDGWRDDTFTATVLLSAWALVRLHQRPSFTRALAAGALCGLACLTRITALTFVVPALGWMVAAAPREQRAATAKHAGVALLIASVVVAPYLISCAIATGDPLFALNYHTVYYRHAEGKDITAPMSAAEYLRTKLTSRPLATFDTGFMGIVVQPFVTKWNGLHQWIPRLDWAAQAAACAGLACLLFSAVGRFLVVMLLTSLLPYAFTWNVGGGGEWRFTMHAYPFYLVAAGVAVTAASMVMMRAQRGSERKSAKVTVLRRAGIVATIVIAGTAAYLGLPWFVVREAIAHGESTSIETGRRDLVFYRSGWSAPHREGVTVRVSTTDRSTVHVPLPAARAYDVVLRMDPVAPDAEQRVSVLFNRRLVGRFKLTYDPQRVGSYRVHVPPEATHAGDNELVVIPEPTIPAGAADPRFSWIDSSQRIGVRLWYVRVLP